MGCGNFILLITPLQILFICDFQDSLLSTVTPRNFISETLSKGVSSKIILVGKASMVLLKSIYFVFLEIWR